MKLEWAKYKLEAGYLVRRAAWNPDTYLTFIHGGYFMYWRRSITPRSPKTWTSEIYILHPQEDDTDWELYEEPEQVHDIHWAQKRIREGKIVGRPSWHKYKYLVWEDVRRAKNKHVANLLTIEDMEAKDWKIYEKPKEKPKEQGHDFAWAVEQIENGIKVRRKFWEATEECEDTFTWTDVTAKDWVLFSNDFIWAKSKINDGFHVSRLSSPGLDIHFDADKDIWISEYKTLESGEYITQWKMELKTWECWEQYIERFRGTDDWIISTTQQEV